MSTNYHTALTAASARKAGVINNVWSDLDQQIVDMVGGDHPWSAPDIDGGTVDGTAIGGATPGAGTVTDLTVLNNLNFGSAFSVGLRTLQSVAASTTTLIGWNLTHLDTDSALDLSDTVYTFTPTVAGYYMLMAGITIDTPAAAKELRLTIEKNGSTRSQSSRDTQGTFAHSVQAAIVLQANGTTDYFDANAYHTDTGNHILSVVPGECFFAGFRIY